MFYSGQVRMTPRRSIKTETRRHRIPFEEHFTILGFSLIRQGKTQHCLEERMQNANKAWWRDVKIYRSKDGAVERQEMVEHVYSIFCFGSENWSWSRALWTEFKDGKQGDETGISMQKRRR